MENRLEIRRQMFHLIAGVAIALLMWYQVLTPLILGIMTIIGLMISFLSRKYRIPGVYWFLKTFGRPDELKTFPGRGPLFFCIGIFFTAVLFPIDVACASVMILAMADSMSHIVGRLYGTIPHPFTDKKFLEGAIAGAVSGFVAAILFVSWYEAFFASVGAMIVEGIDLKLSRFKIDDNITVPMASGAIITLLRFIYP